MLCIRSSGKTGECLIRFREATRPMTFSVQLILHMAVDESSSMMCMSVPLRMARYRLAILAKHEEPYTRGGKRQQFNQQDIHSLAFK
jgi:hypothetical protein